MSDLVIAKKHLSDTLRDRMQKYWDLMKDWYRRKISKDDFDSKARFLLGENNVHLHNEFLFAILVKCQTGFLPSQSTVSSPMTRSPVQQTTISSQQLDTFTAASIKPPKPKKQKISPVVELPYRALDMMEYYDPPKVQLLPRDLDTILLCSHELMLPDMPTLHTRMLLVAWELGLDSVAEESAHLLMLALQCHLKNLIQALISNQTSWKLRPATTFHHSFGHGPSSHSLRFPLPPWSSHSHQFPDMAERVGLRGVSEAEAIRIASLSGPVKELEPLNLFHLRDALKINRHCVPVHSVYSFNMERILAGMWHPSEEEEEQKKTVEQWKKTLEKNTPFAIATAANYGRR